MADLPGSYLFLMYLFDLIEFMLYVNYIICYTYVFRKNLSICVV
ncbi:unnamed protein product [Acanthoscelides obtectus]|uniref:Uncharacterized protein n=1 Tax=Acanthoscelides obtectus TaxID=200917 RepID=A0A9P0P1I6_ACAOB|nr:unnamed protein product [Acanthoscelides obtectus]CAK1632561.1 hypothetical protein AOBTE_LOCUS7623 [Acanthoscelides obtectus]